MRYSERRLAAASASNDSGAQSCAPIGKSNPSGAIPTTSYWRSVDRRRCCRRSPDRRQTSAARDRGRESPGASFPICSSSGRKPRPIDGSTPSAGKKSAETRNPWTFSGSSRPTRFASHQSKAASRSKTSVCFFKSRKSAGETASRRLMIVRARIGEQRDAVDVAHRERAEHERVDHREHRGVRAQAQSQRHDDDGAHRGALDDRAEGMPCFEADGAHEGVSARGRGVACEYWRD